MNAGQSDLFDEIVERVRELKVTHRYTEAAQVLRRALAEAPEDIKLKASLADLYYRIRQYKRALSLAGEILQADPNDPRALVVMGNVMLGRRQPTEALQHFEAALAIAPTDYLWLRMARCQLDLRNPTAAKQALHQAWILNPGNPEQARLQAEISQPPRLRLRPLNRERYSRQILFEPIGEEGQLRIRKATAVLIGCGALGSTLANTLVRAGIGRLVIIDADRLELSNLQRQTLFDEAMVAKGLFKVEAARRALGAINREVDVRVHPERLDAQNITDFVGHPDIVLDATDNFPIRYLINDYCVHEGLSWIYGGCAAAYGMCIPIVPGRTPCLRCLFPEPPPAGAAVTCHQVGILAPIAHTIASLQATEALKWLCGHAELLQPRLMSVDLWAGVFQSVPLKGPSAECPCCAKRRFDFLMPAEGEIERGQPVTTVQG